MGWEEGEGEKEEAIILLLALSSGESRFLSTWICTLILLSGFVVLVTVSFCLGISRFSISYPAGRGILAQPKVSL